VSLVTCKRKKGNIVAVCQTRKKYIKRFLLVIFFCNDKIFSERILTPTQICASKWGLQKLDFFKIPKKVGIYLRFPKMFSKSLKMGF